jgi:hypothetical protein
MYVNFGWRNGLLNNMKRGGRCVPDFSITFVRQVLSYFITLVIDLLPPKTQRLRLVLQKEARIIENRGRAGGGKKEFEKSK